MTFLKTGAWVLVADGGKALFLRNHGNTSDYDLRVVWHQSMENPATRDQGQDRPGRASSASGGRRVALQESDWHQLAEDAFAQDVAKILTHAAQDGVFDQVVIAAAPTMLGTLRAALGPEVSAKVIAEIPKTLANQPIDQIETIIKKALDAA